MEIQAEKLKFDFATATEITAFGRDKFPDKYGREDHPNLEKLFITPDTRDFHIHRIISNMDEDYASGDKFILEWNKIPNNRKGERIRGLIHLQLILDLDDESNWDYKVYDTLEECIANVDGGFGINNLIKEEQ